MNVFYNQKGIGDVLILKIKDIDLQQRQFSTFGDVVKIYSSDTNEVVGYNIFKASSYGEIKDHGAVELSDKMQELIKTAFATNGVNDSVDLQKQNHFVVGYVETMEKHPNADKLNICKVNVGQEELQIVCGAPNVEANQKVVVALVGAVMPSGLIIKDANLRGVPSSGMICSAKELALPDAPQEKGILVLDNSYEIGAPFELK